jgi:predicted ATPase
MTIVARGSDPKLLERAEGLSVLEAALAEAIAGSRGRLVLVRGEAGIGKTALVRQFCDLKRPPVRILWGACEGLFTPRPLGPLVDVAQLIGGEFEDLIERGAPIHDVLSALGEEVAKRAPTVLVIEDLHWADEATLDVIRMLGRRVDRFGALVVATYRDDELGTHHPLRVVLGELARIQDAEWLDIPRLSRDAVALLSEPCGIDPDELYRKTGGNPFFVSEVLASGTGEVPATVRDAVLARAAGVSGPARQLLEAISIAPGSAQIGMLEAVAGDALRCLEECIEHGMVIPAGRAVAFRHELARLVIEESIAPDRRVALHARTLKALAGSSDHARLAHHAEAAGDANAVLRFAPEAARRASALGAHRESAAQYERALRFGERMTPGQRAEILEHRSF